MTINQLSFSDRWYAAMDRTGEATRYLTILLLGLFIVACELVAQHGLDLQLLASEIPHALGHVVIYGLAFGLTMTRGALSFLHVRGLRILLALTFFVIAWFAFSGAIHGEHSFAVASVNHSTGFWILWFYAVACAILSGFLQYYFAHTKDFGDEPSILCIAVGWHALVDTIKNIMFLLIGIAYASGYAVLGMKLDIWTNWAFAGSLALSGTILLFVSPHRHDVSETHAH